MNGCRVRRLFALAAAVVVAIPAKATADCYAGSVPDWNDVLIVEITRCQVTNPDYPCYHEVMAPWREGGIDATMTAYRFHGRVGRYAAQSVDGSQWVQVVQLLRQADFFNLQIPFPRPSDGKLGVIVIDGPHDQLTVRRCNQSVTINGDLEDSSEYRRFIALVSGLEAIVAALPWERRSDGASITNADVERDFLP
jgi:hypothetical protein